MVQKDTKPSVAQGSSIPARPKHPANTGRRLLVSTHYIALRKKNSNLRHIKCFYSNAKHFKMCFSSNTLFALFLFCTSS